MLDASREEQLRAALRKSAHVIQELKADLGAYHEPIAVIGMACRFPGGVETPEQYWQLLAEGIDAIGALPPHRIHPVIQQQQASQGGSAPTAPTLQGGFLAAVDHFDAPFFGISPREALVMDPQQRLLLEVTWEALESAHLIPAQLAESETGVFVGIFNDDYSQILYANEAIDQENMFYAMTGNYRSVAAGRIAYTFGLVGPAVAVDTACSSALVAIHQACQSLRNNECTMALAGGSHLILYEQWATRPTKATDAMFAANGRCKTFDAAADGFGRGEGCGMVVLKRLSAAQRDGDTILAVIRGTALNQDGRSSGLTAPSGPAQQRVIRRALADGGVDPGQVGYIEAHGTGTHLGDPIEIGALNAVFHDRSDPLWVGSVKTNFGHLEATAGVAGLIKVILGLQQGKIPPNLHFHTPNPYIDWQDSPVKIPTTLTDWPAAQRIAGISSFGISGTNAHLVVEAAPAPATTTTPQLPDQPYQLLPLSAKSADALLALVHKYQNFLATSQTPLRDLCYSAQVGRSHFEYRLGLVADSVQSLQAKLAAVAATWSATGAAALTTPDVSRGFAPAHQPAPKIAFLFTGQGSQYVGMGQALYQSDATFRTIIDRCEPIMQAALGRSLLALLYPKLGSAPVTPADANDLLESHPCGQAVNFALECALVEVWKSWGVTPDLVLGHSLGDFAAAYAAGVLTLEDGLRLVIERGRLMESAVGMMVAVAASEAAVAPYLTSLTDVTIGVINGPSSVVISGSQTGVEAVAAQLQAAGFKTKRLAIPMAAHSPLLDPVLAAFETAVRRVNLSSPKLTVVSSMTGALVTAELTDPTYWRHHLRNPVRFADGVAALYRAGARIFIEIGPKATLLGLAEPIVARVRDEQADRPTANVAPLFLPSLREGKPDWQRLLMGLGELYVHGVPIDWGGLNKGDQRRKTQLPTYPFQRQRYWLDTPPKRQNAALRPLIDKMTLSPAIKERIFETAFSVAAFPWLADHQVYGEIVSPGACQLAMVLSAAELTLGQHHALQLHDVLLPQPLVLPPAGDQQSARTVQVVVTPVAANGSGPHHAFTLFSFTADDKSLLLKSDVLTHATGAIVAGPPVTPSPIDLVALRQRCTHHFDLVAFYQTLQERTVALGAGFRWLKALWHSEAHPAEDAPREALAQIERPAAIRLHDGDLLHTGLLDACFQVAVTARSHETETAPLLPFALTTLHLHRPATGHTWWCHAKQVGDRQWDMQLCDEAGGLVATFTGFAARPAPPQAIQRQEIWREWLYAPRWEAQPNAPQPAVASPSLTGQPWLIFADRQGVGAALAARLRQHGAIPTLVYGDETAVEGWRQSQPDSYLLHPHQADHYRTLLATLTNGQAPLRLVHLWSLDTPALGATVELASATQLGCGSVLSLVQSLVEQPTLPAGLWLVTAGAQAVQPAETMHGIAQAPLWGLGKVIALEYPELACVCIDLAEPAGQANWSAESTEQLFAELMTTAMPGARETQIALRPGVRYLARLARHPQVRGSDTLTLPVGPYRLTISHQGTLDNLQFSEQKRRSPAADEIEVAVQASGLNFRDVLNALGLNPNTAGILGSECAGVVTAVGASVKHLAVGDRVMGLVSNAFSQFVTAKADYFTLVPTALSVAAAATIPAVYLTVYYAFHELANLKPRDRVLIHAATGGVGQAAIQLARAIGAEVYGTASPAKWQVLRDLGVTHIYNSRSLDFADQIMADTAGEGVDLVLNSLTGEGFIAASLQVLRQQGRFIEISRRGIWSAAEMAEVRPDVCYQLLDLGEVAATQSPVIKGMFDELTPHFVAGRLTPLPQTCFPLEEAKAAFRYMQQARHTGKIIFTHPNRQEPILHPKASYLITGGLGGLGLAVAHWLATQGAGHLILMGRSQPAPATQAQISALATQGVMITIAQADVTDPQQVQRIVAQIPSAYPLRGVIHAAGVLADGALAHQDWRRFATVLAPKVQGAWQLHEATKALPLDFFVLFSSIAGLFGNRGQANHAAANAFLDAFAHYRRSQGLPALSINWGAWAEVGAAAELVRSQHPQLAAQGLGAISPEQGVATLAALLTGSATQVAVTPIHWPTRLQNQAVHRPFYQAFQPTTPLTGPTQADDTASLQQQLTKADASERRALIEQTFRTVVARVLAVPSPQSLDLRQGLVSLGLDSLMSIEVRNRLKQLLTVELPVTTFLDNLPMQALVEQINTHYTTTALASAAPLPPPPLPQPGAPAKKIRRTL